MAERERCPTDVVAWRMRPMSLELLNGAERASRWSCGPIFVISALNIAEPPDGVGDPIPQWHISISAAGKRPKPHHIRKALRAFGMVGAENDTHHPGNAVHFWMAVDPARRVTCQCKTDEETIVEPGGHRRAPYRWTNPKPGEGPCRGCEIAPVTGRACPLHGEARP